MVECKPVTDDLLVFLIIKSRMNEKLVKGVNEEELKKCRFIQSLLDDKRKFYKLSYQDFKDLMIFLGETKEAHIITCYNMYQHPVQKEAIIKQYNRRYGNTLDGLES